MSLTDIVKKAAIKADKIFSSNATPYVLAVGIFGILTYTYFNPQPTSMRLPKILQSNVKETSENYNSKKQNVEHDVEDKEEIVISPDEYSELMKLSNQDSRLILWRAQIELMRSKQQPKYKGSIRFNFNSNSNKRCFQVGQISGELLDFDLEEKYNNEKDHHIPVNRLFGIPEMARYKRGYSYFEHQSGAHISFDGGSPISGITNLEMTNKELIREFETWTVHYMNQPDYVPIQKFILDKLTQIRKNK